MRRSTQFAAVAALFAVALTSGCGGGGGGSASPSGPGPDPGNSAYVGHYSGTVQSSIDNATTAFDVDTLGALNGTLQFSKITSPVTVTGSIDTSGKITANYTVNSHSYTASGPLTSISTSQYTVILSVHDNTSNADEPNASMTVTRS